MSESMTLYKLMILFMLDKVDFPLTNAQISSFILEKEYTSYFVIQQAIAEMLEANLLKMENVRNSSFYNMTEEGEKTLRYFGDKISDAIKTDILVYLKENKFSLRNEVSIIADYYRTTNKEYEVCCRVKEKHSNLIDLKLTVATEEQAIHIADNWKEKSQELYAYIMEQLL